MKLIPLTQNKVTLVDDTDYELLSRFKWFARFDGFNWYAARKFGGRTVSMQEFLMGRQSGTIVDHKDKNGLNNQRLNLRRATHAQNCYNRFHRRANTSGFKGVRWLKSRSRWVAEVFKAGKSFRAGSFTDPVKAAYAYDAAADWRVCPN